jgi:hypothetical protein
MLEFKFDSKTYVISDDYSITPKNGDLVNSIWQNILLDSEPSRPCPIDRMCVEMQDLGADIKKYTPEFNPDVLY